MAQASHAMRAGPAGSSQTATRKTSARMARLIASARAVRLISNWRPCKQRPYGRVNKRGRGNNRNGVNNRNGANDQNGVNAFAAAHLKRERPGDAIVVPLSPVRAFLLTNLWSDTD